MNDHQKNMLRILSSAMEFVGYISLVQFNQYCGITLELLSGIFIVPWAIKNKAYDIVLKTAIFTVLDLNALRILLLTGDLPSG